MREFGGIPPEAASFKAPSGESEAPQYEPMHESTHERAETLGDGTVPDAELVVDYSRSSGPGGQNVNKRETKADVRWRVHETGAFTEEQKALIAAYAKDKGRINKAGEIFVYDQTQRSREQNRASAVERLQQLVREALTPEKERKATKPTYGAKQRRMDDKSRHSGKKQARKFDPGEGY